MDILIDEIIVSQTTHVGLQMVISTQVIYGEQQSGYYNPSVDGIVALEKDACLKVYDPITFGFIHRNGVFLVSDESSYFPHYPSEIRHATDVTSENVAKAQKLL